MFSSLPRSPTLSDRKAGAFCTQGALEAEVIHSIIHTPWWRVPVPSYTYERWNRLLSTTSHPPLHTPEDCLHFLEVCGAPRDQIETIRLHVRRAETAERTLRMGVFTMEDLVDLLTIRNARVVTDDDDEVVISRYAFANLLSLLVQNLDHRDRMPFEQVVAHARQQPFKLIKLRSCMRHFARAQSLQPRTLDTDEC